MWARQGEGRWQEMGKKRMREDHEGLLIQVTESGLKLKHSRKQLQGFREGMA